MSGPTPVSLPDEVRKLIDPARKRIAAAMSAGLTLLYRQVGARIRTEVLHGERAEYGQQVGCVACAGTHG